MAGRREDFLVKLDKEILTTLLITAIGTAFGTALFNALPIFWNFGARIILSLFFAFSSLWVILFVHNLFYHATFLWVECLYYYSVQDYEKALQASNKIRDTRPSDPSSYISQAQINIGKKDIRSALASLNAGLETIGFDKNIIILKVDILRELKDWKEVSESIQLLINNNIDDDSWFYNQATAYFQLGNFTKGVRALRQLVSNQQNYIKSLEAESKFQSVRKGLWHLLATQELVIQKLEKEELDWTNVFYAPGLDDKVLREWETLIKSIQESLSKAPENIDLHYQLLEAFFRIGKYQDGIQILKNIAESAKTRAKEFVRTSAYSSVGKELREAATVYQKIIEIFEFLILYDDTKTPWQNAVENIETILRKNKPS
jgi:tetratricopeptide (TPR) repeat protein